MPCGDGGRVVEKEQLREAAGLQQQPALPATELEPAGNPTPAVVASANAPGLVVEASTVPVDETTRWVRDQLAERRGSVV